MRPLFSLMTTYTRFTEGQTRRSCSKTTLPTKPVTPAKEHCISIGKLRTRPGLLPRTESFSASASDHNLPLYMQHSHEERHEMAAWRGKRPVMRTVAPLKQVSTDRETEGGSTGCSPCVKQSGLPKFPSILGQLEGDPWPSELLSQVGCTNEETIPPKRPAPCIYHQTQHHHDALGHQDWALLTLMTSYVLLPPGSLLHE